MKMKKFLALLLATLMVFAMAACAEETPEVSSTSSAAGVSSEAPVSSEEAASEAESSESVTPSEEPSEAPSEDTSSEDEDVLEAPALINKFVSIGTVSTKDSATGTNALPLTGVDVEPAYGAMILYTAEYGVLDAEELAEFAVVAFAYDHEYFGYVKTAFYEVGEAEEISADEDGFVLAIHSSQETFIPRARDIKDGTTVFPHGLHLYTGVDYSVNKAETAPAIDGVVADGEWDAYLIDSIDAENEAWSYAQFEKDNYYATADYYVTYDDTYLYLCVVVQSPYHYCPIDQSSASSMWQYECIQVKYSSKSPAGEYISEHFDRVIDKTADNEKVVISSGFAVNDSGDTCYYGVEDALVACSRDDGEQITVYEVAVSFAELGITPEKGTELGLTFSINSTNEEDISKNVWKNITYRCGGGIIGRNDYAKIPVITLN
jgi:hypothetical protein